VQFCSSSLNQKTFLSQFRVAIIILTTTNSSLLWITEQIYTSMGFGFKKFRWAWNHEMVFLFILYILISTTVTTVCFQTVGGKLSFYFILVLLSILKVISQDINSCRNILFAFLVKVQSDPEVYFPQFEFPIHHLIVKTIYSWKFLPVLHLYV